MIGKEKTAGCSKCVKTINRDEKIAGNKSVRAGKRNGSLQLSDRKYSFGKIYNRWAKVELGTALAIPLHHDTGKLFTQSFPEISSGTNAALRIGACATVKAKKSGETGSATAISLYHKLQERVFIQTAPLPVFITINDDYLKYSVRSAF